MSSSGPDGPGPAAPSDDQLRGIDKESHTATPGERAVAAADAVQEESPAPARGAGAETAAGAGSGAGEEDAGASDYASPEVEGTSAGELEDLLADLARRIELGEVDDGTLRVRGVRMPRAHLLCMCVNMCVCVRARAGRCCN